MIAKSDPFTRTPGVAGKAYIDNGVADEIMQNFCDPDSAKFVYKITGLRGAGKSVEYSKLIQNLKKEKEWKVYTLSSSGDAVKTLIAKLRREDFINNKKVTTSVSTDTSVEGDIKVIKGSETIKVSRNTSDNDNYYSDEAELTKMIELANSKKYKILIGIDDIAKTPPVVELLSIINSMLMEGLKVYIVVTGLSENIEDFKTEKNLTFFKRADTIEIKALSKYDIAYMYKKLLGVSDEEAKRMEQLSLGYAYAYQVLGSLYYKKDKEKNLEDLIPDFERTLFKDSYDLVWGKLTSAEKEFVRCVCDTKDGKVSDIKSNLDKIGKKSNYSVIRARLINKHVLDGDTDGYLKIKLPRFKRFIELWGDE